MSLVSVIIPLYNKARYIKRAVQSVLNQTFENFELIIVDDGSTDESLEIVRGITDDRLRVIQQANAGPGAARNRGMDESSGEFLAFLDADDEWTPHFLERTVLVLKEQPECAMVIPRRFFNRDDPQEPVRHAKANGLKDGAWRMPPSIGALAMEWAIGDCNLSHLLHRTEILRRYGGCYEQNRCMYAEGAYLFVQILLNHPIYRLMEPLVYQDHAASELYVGRKNRFLPVPPMVSDPEPIRSNCHPGYQEQLEQWLALRALRAAVDRVRAGEEQMARHILRTFPGANQYALEYWSLLADMRLRKLCGGKLPLHFLMWKLVLNKNWYRSKAKADIRRAMSAGYQLGDSLSL